MVVYATVVSIKHIHEYKSISNNKVNVLTKPKIEDILNNYNGIQCNCSGNCKIYTSVSGFHSHMNTEKHKLWHKMNILKFELKNQKEYIKQANEDNRELRNIIEEHEETIDTQELTINKLKKKYKNKKDDNVKLKKSYDKSLSDIQKYKSTYISDSD
jgi:hypothetical protein